jgi:hypothetical protein
MQALVYKGDTLIAESNKWTAHVVDTAARD